LAYQEKREREKERERERARKKYSLPMLEARHEKRKEKR
jgi:hypothetical protein